MAEKRSAEMTRWRLTVFGVSDERCAISLPLTDEQALSIDPDAEKFEGDLSIGEAFLERVRL